MSLPQFRSLVRINRTPSASLSAVAEHLGASLPTTSRIIGGLVDRGLLARADNRRDRRQIALVITRRGKAVLAAARHGAQKKMEAELLPLSPRQRASVVAAMEILENLFGPSVKISR
jgi:DNA-binding MarR family transcriptional regulator